jgi:hypothetical protein
MPKPKTLNCAQLFRDGYRDFFCVSPLARFFFEGLISHAPFLLSAFVT